MLDVLNRYAHGFVVVPAVLASRKGGLLGALAAGPVGADELCRTLGANSGHLQVTLRLLQSLGWIDEVEDSVFRATPELRKHELIPDDLRTLLDKDMDAYLRHGPGGFLAPYVDRSASRWGIDDEMMADFCDSLLVVPLLGLLAKRDVLGDLVERDFSILPEGVRQEAIDLLSSLQWIEANSGKHSLTKPGEFMFERAMNLGLAESYRPMLRALDELLFGDAEAAFGCDEHGHELHVDRNLNVIASGFMHDKFFAEVEDIIVSIFSKTPISEQPKHVADMGCGDGTFLKRVYETVRDKTPRGERLDEYPLTLIGVDLNQASLDETSRTLSGIGHEVVAGDIGNPRQVVDDIAALGIDPDSILHIRSFLDHDRPYVPPLDGAAIAAREGARYLGAYADRKGRSIPPAYAVQSLVEHLRRWADVITDHGFVLLEVHCQDPLVVRKHMDQSESLYFDAVEGYSHQLLVEADAALMSAAEAGLFPDRRYFRKFPGVLPYCRITLNRFERRPYRVRMASASDLPALLRLEDACWAEGMRTSGDELLRRIRNYPLGQWVLELDDNVVGVVYSQRVADIEELRSARLSDIGALSDRDGPVVQLLSLNVFPEYQQLGLGDQLLDLMLMRSAVQGGVEKVAGLTRCSRFQGHNFEELEAYIEQRDSSQAPVDPIMQFHHKHGAAFLGAVPDYRPEDEDNLGAGVLLCYDVSGPGTDLRSTESGGSALHLDEDADTPTRLEACLRTVLGRSNQDAFSWKRSLRDMGIDSLGLLEFRTLLQQAFDRQLSPTFFFSHSTLAAIRQFFDSLEEDTVTERTDAASAVDLERGDEEVRVAAPGQASPPERSDIAIIGMAGRFPGCSNLDAYWSLLSTGADAISEVPASRWDIDAYYDQDPDAPGKILSRHGGFIDAVDEFDASFFDISPHEARLMDPQQRLLMETHWEAMEHAGIDASGLKGTNCGIFVGLYTHDYELLQVANGRDEDLGAYFATGNSASIAAGRIAYFLGTRGPALTIDTACSSSLVAVHQAIQSLRTGQSEVAIASGASLMLAPRLSIIFSKAGMLAADGRCKTFDAAADGYVRSEGCAAVVLKRLDEAQRDGDRILGVLRGSCINQDGASNGLTAPNLVAQEELLQGALRDASLRPSDIDFIEAHGTGTNLGDPVEFAALNSVFGGDPERTEPLLLASVKTNIGHAEAAAGIAGLIKTVLAMQNGIMPAHLNFHETNPMIPLDELPARIPLRNEEWRNAERPLRAGVSSFGFSGTNAHVLIEQAPAQVRDAADPAVSNHLLAISAKSQPALGALAQRYIDWLPGQSEARIPDIGYTSRCGRAHHDYRIAATGTSKAELVKSLQQSLAGISDRRAANSAPRIAFIFTGQGSQYLNMARELAVAEPCFRDNLRRCQAVLADEMERSLEDLVFAGPADCRDDCDALNDTAVTQPVLFAIEYALARMLQSWGIEPCAVMGHSVGEYVAACIAGVFSLEDGLRLIAARGRLMASLPAGGAMCAVLGKREASHDNLIADSGVSIAAFNGPENLVISGAERDIQRVIGPLEDSGLKVVPLQVSHAFHSTLMEPILPAFREVTRWVSFAPPELKLVSNVSGKFEQQAVTEADYWVSHIRQPVRFEESVATLLDDGIDIMLEVGPHPVLTYMGQAIEAFGEGRDGTAPVAWVGTLNREAGAWDSLHASLKELYERGVDLNWSAVDAVSGGRITDIPAYPWQRKSFWFEERAAAATAPRPQGAADVLYQPAWIARSHLDSELPARPPGSLPDVDSLSAATAEARSVARSDYHDGTISAATDRVCANYILQAFRQMGWDYQVDDTVTARELIERHRLLPRFVRLVHRMLQILSEDGYLSPAGEQFVVGRDLLAGPVDLGFPDNAHAECDAEYRLLKRCAGHLLPVLRGDTDPLELIFPSGRSSNSLRDGHCVSWKSAPGQVERPPGSCRCFPRTGPSMSSRTSPICSSTALRRNSATTRLCVTNYSMRGYAEGRFDLVIASNVLHATVDLKDTIGNVSQVLSPGGMLLLVEGVQKTRWIDLVFGLTEGWWRFQDNDLRPDYPLLTASQWTKVLHECGMESVSVNETSEANAASSADMFNQAVIIAQTSRASVANDVRALPRGEDDTHWAILADQSGVAAGCADALLKRGATCDLVYLENKPSDDTSSQCVASAAELGSVIAGLVRERTGKKLRLLDLWSADPIVAAPSGDDPLDAVANYGLQFIDVVRAAAAVDIDDLTVVTAGGRHIHDCDEIDVVTASLAGLGNVAWAEYPGLNVQQLDLDAGDDVERRRDCLLAELVAQQRDIRVAYRSGHRYVQTMQPVSGRAAEFSCSADGVYLIVGGMGDLGMHTARYLVQHGARRLVLVGRTDFPDQATWDDLESDAILGPKIRIARDLEQAGAQVEFRALDVCDRQQVEELVSGIAGSAPIRGVVQAAAIISDQLIGEVAERDYRAVLKPKVSGTWYLLEALKGQELEFFAFYSSIGSVIGLPGQASYAAANAFLDALAVRLQSRGVHAVSINWCGWDGTGLAKTGGGQRAIAELKLVGIDSLHADDAVKQLGIAMTSGSWQAVTIPLVVEAGNTDSFSGIDPQLRDLRRRFSVRPQKAIAAQPEAPPVADLAGLAGEELGERLRQVVIGSVAELLDLRAADVGPDSSFGDLGMDSLLGLEFRKIMQARCGVVLSATLVWNYPTVGAMVSHIGQLLGVPADNALPSAAQVTPTESDTTSDLVSARIDELSDEDALYELMGKSKAS
jgi:acyl transferase domain-containing protein/NAD(P)-dependent dehydrogenase (short-subunit alcohol dehydrogenase family)/acyl carrier protein/ubiquinone/menaquinone biosynthesis C-methylase UbiE/ribosomal protein S18 acetylase RimI-like enzyme